MLARHSAIGMPMEKLRLVDNLYLLYIFQEGDL